VKVFSTHAALVALLLLARASQSFAESPDQVAIMAAMHVMFDENNAELVISPVVVEGDFAIADWIQGGAGGRAFLRKDADKWALVLCSGDAIRSAAALASVGVPVDAARRLALAITAAEKGIPTDRLKKFASFQGMVPMDARSQR